MTIMPKFKTKTSVSTDIAYAGNRATRLFGVVDCPNCKRQLRASDVCDLEGEGEYVLRCSGCHCDILQITRV